MQSLKKIPRNHKKLLGLLLSLTLFLAIVPIVVFNTAPPVSAAAPVSVSTQAALQTAINNAPNNEEQVINVTAGFSVASTVNIPANKIIKLNVPQANTIIWDDTKNNDLARDRHWLLDYDIKQASPVFEVAAGATLSIDGGGQIRSQGVWSGVVSNRTKYITRTAIINSGTLNVINAIIAAGMSDTGDYMVDAEGTAGISSYASAVSIAVGIRNQATGVVNFSNGRIQARTGSFAWSTSSRGYATSVSVGIQNDKGGTVNMTGGNILVRSKAGSGKPTALSAGNAHYDCHAIGITNGINGKTTISGGSINAENIARGRDNAGGTYYGSSVGVSYQENNYPNIYDGEINTVFTNAGDSLSWQKSEAAVGSEPTGLSHTPPSQASSYKDEGGNLINTGGSATLTGGMIPGRVKVAIYYRFWNNTSKTGTPQVFTLNNPSLAPMLGDKGQGANYLKLGEANVTNPNPGTETTQALPYALPGDSTINSGYTSAGKYLGFNSGGLPKNTDYYYLHSLAYNSIATTNAPNHNSASHPQMAEFSKFNEDPDNSLYRNPGIVTATGNKVYVYVDYVKQNTYNLRVSLSSDPRVQLSTYTMTYQNRATVAGTGTGTYDLPIYIFNTYGVPVNDAVKTHKNITDAYNLNAADTHGHLNVTYKHKLSIQGDDAYVDGLPMLANAAGQDYKVRIYVPSDTTYSPNSKNVTTSATGYFEITLKIERAQVQLTPNTPFTTQPTYGTRLSAINLNNEVAIHPSFQHVDGSYTWLVGSNVVPEVVTGDDPYFYTDVTFTPSQAFIANYAPVTFSAKIKILPKPLTIYAGTETSRKITATYGNWPVYTAFFEGLAANDLLSDGKTPRPEILADLDYKVKIGEDYAFYKSGANPNYLNPSLDAGTYLCQIDGFDNKNYATIYESGELEIGKRTLTLTAKAPESKHFDGTFNVDVELTSPRGNASWHNVGTTSAYSIIYPQTIQGLMEDYLVSDGRPVRISVPALPVLSGAQAHNYNVALDGLDNLTTIIVKAMAVYEIPEFTDTYVYDSTNKLSNQAGSTFALPAVNNVPNLDNGHWEWDASVVGTAPEVGNTGYKAWFIPEDIENFDPSEVSIVIPVAKKEVEVTIGLRNPSIETFYGDAVPGFVFKFSGFTGTDTEDNITMTGNYTMSCAYQKGSNAGNYPIIVTLNNLASKNYSYVGVNSSLEVKKRPVYIKPNAITKEYGYILSEGDFSSQITNMVEGDSTSLLGTLSYMTEYHHNSLETRGVKDGGYTINVTASGNPQNYDIVYQTNTLTITKAELRFTASNISNLEYGSPTPDLSNTYTVTGYKFNETPADAFTGSPLISTTYIQGNPVDTYDITISRSNLASNNYNIVIEQRHGYLTVVQATPTVSSWPTATVEHSTPLASALIDTTGASASVIGHYAFDQLDYNADYENDNDPNVKHKIIFYPDDTNYRSVVGYISLLVLQKEIEGTVGIVGSPVLGETLAVDLSTMNPSTFTAFEITWLDSADPTIIVGSGENLIIDETMVNKRISVRIDAVGAYTGFKISTPTSRIVDAEGLSDVTLSLFNIDFDFDETYVYAANSISASITKKPEYSSGMGAEPTIKYNNSTTAPKDAGTYRVTLDISAGSVYKPVSGLYVGTFTIQKAPLVASYSPVDKVYDGTKKATAGSALTFDGKFGNDDVSINTTSATYEFASANASNQQVHVAVKNAKVEGSQAGNYYIDDSRNFARIEKRSIQVTAVPVKRAYEPDNYYVAVNFQPNYTGVLSFDRDYVAIEQGQGRLPSNDNNAGFKPILEITANVIGTEYGDQSQNYKVAVTNLSGLTVEIEKATPNYGALPIIDPVTYNYDRPLSSIRISTSGNWTWNNPTLIPQVINEGYSAKYTPSASQQNNYKTLDLTLPLTVLPKEVKIYASVLDVVRYGDPEPRVNISYRGISPNENENEVIKGGPAVYSTTYSQYAPAGGDYSIFVDPNSVFADNYYFTYDSDNPSKIIVNPVTLTVNATPISRPYIPADTSVQIVFSALSGILRNDDVQLVSAVSTANVNDASAGNNKTITSFNSPELTGVHAANYNVVIANQANLKVDITKAIPTGHSFPSRATVEFGNTLAYAQFTGASTGDLGGYFSYENRDEKPNIGIYTDYVVVYHPGDAANYEEARQTVHLEVIRAIKNFNLTVTGNMILGTTLKAEISGLNAEEMGHIIFSWYRINPSGGDPQLVLQGTDASEYELGEDDKGFQIILRAELNSPYEGQRTYEGTRLVTEEILTFWQKFAKWWYDLISALQAIFGKLSF